MSQLRRYTEAVATKITERGVRSNRLDNVMAVIEYPKSGGTWLAKMLASLLDLRRVDNLSYVPLQDVVIRSHWAPTGLPGPGVYLMRDGRDVMVSLFHHRVRRAATVPAIGERVNRIYPFDIQVERIREQMPEFIEVEMTRRTPGSPLPWPQHVLAGIANDSLAKVRYEDLRTDAVGTLAGLMPRLAPELDVRVERIVAATSLHDRSNVLSPTHGMGSSSLRSGVVGEWTEVFSEDAIAVFDAHAGQAMAAAGYAPETA